MTDFQIAAASLIILLEVFSEVAWGDSQKLSEMRKRVIDGEFWDRLGGLDELEERLRSGFSTTFRDPDYDIHGNPVPSIFPREIDTFFATMGSCEQSDVKVDVAKAALPVLRSLLARS